MTSEQKRYSHTEKDALAVKWAKTRFRIYLLGAPKLKIITSQKPLIPMFSKACSKLTPRIEKWIMKVQDDDSEIIYEPGKDTTDPMDYLSQHLLLEIERDDTQQTINAIICNEHVVVMKGIKGVIASDFVLQDIMKIMKENDWKRQKDRPEIKPYYLVKHELYQTKGFLLRCRLIVIPEKLQKQVIITAHSLGQFVMTRTKHMLQANIGSHVFTVWSKTIYPDAISTR